MINNAISLFREWFSPFKKKGQGAMPLYIDLAGTLVIKLT